MFVGIKRIHLVGIGGSGMSSIAEVLLKLGYEVSGSDIQQSGLITRLKGLGARISIPHQGRNIGGADVVVYSNAIALDNPEILAAKGSGVPIIPRAEMLAGLMRMSKCGIAVAGTHGKTSTACMIAEVLRTAKLDPTVVVGGIVSDIGSGGRLGAGDILVAEACESDGTILKLSPTIGVITSLEREHMERYESEEALFDTFVRFANDIPFYGMMVMCLDQPNLRALMPEIKRRLVTYGLTTQADVMGKDATFKDFESQFEVHRRHGRNQQRLGQIQVAAPGFFSVYNALGAVTVGLELGISFEVIREGLANFVRPKRRFELIGVENDTMVLIDYGHHPTEIRETLRAARLGWQRRLLVVFQPHRFTRTKDLLAQFFTAFNEADFLVITSIYPAGEKPIEGIDGRLIHEGVRRQGHRSAHYVADKSAAAERLVEEARPGDMVLVLGAGDIYTIGDVILERIRNKREVEA
ncbi:MAG: UDP-N-acetylmuramate--L-alanine ligase [Candidatus Coatesbacteria bacterium]|nr:UDP-N-acetylmuramate--L-alanine ligase [Candidatus Coatesbacteria bacterium]